MKESGFRFATLAIALFSLIAIFSSAAFGQAEAGTISGTVRDTSGAVVSGAKVTATNVATSATRTAQTGNLGQYSIPSLAPGNYNVTISNENFSTFKTTAEVTVGGVTTVDAQLKVGSSSTVVEVTAGAATQVNTQTQELSQLIDTQQVHLLPSLTRNPYDFVALSGNVSSGDTTSNGATTTGGANNGQEMTNRGVGYSINGQRETGTEILLDGAENISIFSVNIGTNIPVDGVQEYSIVTNNFSAEYGRASGGVVNVTTKSGTNNWHGTAWEFNRLSAYTANTYNNAVNNLPKGAYTRNQFGFQVGGPIVKNKLFVSESTEWTRVRSNSVQTEEVFDPSFIALLPDNAQNYFKAFGTTTLPSTGVASTWGQWLTAGTGGTCFFVTATGACTTPLVNGTTPIPNSQPVLDNVVFKVPFNAGGGPPQNSYTLVGRLDYNLSDKTQLFFRAAREHDGWFLGTNSFGAYPQYDTGILNQDQSYLLSLTHSFNTNLLNNTKLSFARYNNATSFNSAYLLVPNLMFVTPADPVTGGIIQMPGLENSSAPGAGGLPAGGPQNTVQIQDDLSWNKGRHNMRFGGQFTYLQLNYAYGAYLQAVEQLGSSQADSMRDLMNAGGAAGSQLAGNQGFAGRVGPGVLPCPVNQWGEFIGSTVPPTALNYGQVGTNNCPASSDLTPPLSSPSVARSYRYRDFAIYAQDSFRMKPRLTLNYGLRWEHYGVQHNNNQNLDSNFYLGSGSYLFQQVANGNVFLTQKSPTGQFWQNQWGTLAPRVGFAYDLFGDGKSSLRGGFGISYERNFGNVTYNSSFNPPASAVLTTTCPAATSTCLALVTNSDLGPLGLSSTPASALPPSELRFVSNKIRTAQTQFWSLALQREVARNTIVEVGYSGAHGVHLYDLNNVNNVGMAQAFMGAALTTAPDPVTGAPCPWANAATGAAECLTRPNPQYSNINERGSGGTSAYEALNIKVQTQNLHNTGLSLVANYTWAHSLDDISSTFSDSIQGGSGTGVGSLGYTSVINPKLDWGNSDYDVRNRFVVSPIWTTPWLKGEKGLLGRVAGGWSLAGIFTARTGIPFSFFDLDNEEFFYTIPRLTPATPITNYQVSSNPKQDAAAAASHNNNVWDLLTIPLPASFGPLNPALGISDYGPFPAGMIHRNAFRGPGAWNLDAALQKDFRVTERFGLTFRAEGFNIFNHHNMYVQSTSLFYASQTTTPFVVTGLKGGLNNFATGGNNDERRFGQFSLRVTF
jgi:Carboxypeptidase regulatory-like domain/TonB dependent receptor